MLSAVNNYNRRSAILNEILLKTVKVATKYYSGDKFGVFTKGTTNIAADCYAVNLHRIGGSDYSD